jgi:hypothetical protein
MTRRPLGIRLVSTAIAAAAVALSQPAFASIVAESEPNDSQITAQNLDPNFSMDADAEITNSTTMAHSSIRAGSSDTASYDWYSFTVALGGTTGIFDIDHAMPNLDPWLSLFDSGGNLLFTQDDGGLTDPGSAHPWDSYFTYDFADAGTYFVRVGEFCCDAPTSGSYVLHVSLGEGAVPEPATWAMMLLGFGAAGVAMRRQKARKPQVA